MKLFYQSLFLMSLFLFVMACKKEEDEPIINTETYEVAPNLTNGHLMPIKLKIYAR